VRSCFDQARACCSLAGARPNSACWSSALPTCSRLTCTHFTSRGVVVLVVLALVLLLLLVVVHARMARAGVATSDSPSGHFTFKYALQPDGIPSLDMSLFLDPLDHQAYFVRSCDNAYAGISRLTPDFLNSTGIISTHDVRWVCVHVFVRPFRASSVGHGRVVGYRRRS
jgi:hypothetical protein